MQLELLIVNPLLLCRKVKLQTLHSPTNLRGNMTYPAPENWIKLESSSPVGFRVRIIQSSTHRERHLTCFKSLQRCSGSTDLVVFFANMDTEKGAVVFHPPNLKNMLLVKLDAFSLQNRGEHQEIFENNHLETIYGKLMESFCNSPSAVLSNNLLKVHR